MSIPELLRRAAESDRLYCDGVTGPLSHAELYRQALVVADELRDRGVGPGDRVAVMAGNAAPGHLPTVFGLALLRAIWVPVNTRLRGSSLRHLLTDSDPALVLVDDASVTAVAQAGIPAEPLAGLRATAQPIMCQTADQVCTAAQGASPDDVLALIYTSGTTGSPKGVQVTERMWVAAAEGARIAAGCEPGDRLLVWEPWCHIGGAQVLLLPLLTDVSLAVLERFSASRFWSDAHRLGATHVHHLGGIAQILLHRPPSELDRAHGVRVSWGGGIDAETWRALEQRFGLRVHECYGMTETSSINTVNTAGPDDGVGRVLPAFAVRVTGPDGAEVPAGTTGRIQLSDRGAGLLTPGYFRRAEATAESRRGDWWDTGDLGQLDAEGNLHFRGRASDSVRRRGENVSAQWVEQALLAHPSIAEAAVVAVPSELADEEILACLVVIEPVDPGELVAHCRARLADFEVPRYVRFVEALPKTPSQRVAKASLDRTTHDCLDLGGGRPMNPMGVL